MQPTEIRIAGFGEQGVILSATKAASSIAGNHATMTQDLDPDSADSYSAQVIVSDQPITYHYVNNPDVLVVTSQEAYIKYSPEVRPGGIIIFEEELVRVAVSRDGSRVYGIPAMRLAEEIGSRKVLNIIMLGFFAAIAGVVQRESLRTAVEHSVPTSFRELNLKAYDRGYEVSLQSLCSLRPAGPSLNLQDLR